MNNLLSLLPYLAYLAYLACPVGMGLMMWFMMRENKGQAADTHGVQMGAQASTSVNDHGVRQRERAVWNAEGAEAAPAPGVTGIRATQGRFRIGGMCLDPKVIAGLALVGLSVWALAPGFVWAALPLLLLAACPLSMLFMMRGMQGSQSGHNVQGSHCASHTINRARPSSDLAAGATTSDEPPAGLRRQLSILQAQQEAIAREIARLEDLESAPPPRIPTVAVPPTQIVPELPSPAQAQAVSSPGAPTRG